MIVADTSALLPLFDGDDVDHERVADAVVGLRDPLVVSPFVLAEVDDMVMNRLGVQAELEVLRELAFGDYELPPLASQDLDQAIEVVERYADQEIGLADASIVVLANRYRTRRILTLDHRHFDVLRPLDGGRFTLLPGR